VKGVTREGQAPLWIIGERGTFELDEDSQTFRRVTGALDTWTSKSRVNDAVNLGDGSIAIATSFGGYSSVPSTANLSAKSTETPAWPGRSTHRRTRRREARGRIRQPSQVHLPREHEP